LNLPPLSGILRLWEDSGKQWQQRILPPNAAIIRYKPQTLQTKQIINADENAH
jgi:hypothetical protein